jgi:hypothetical protein
MLARRQPAFAQRAISHINLAHINSAHINPRTSTPCGFARLNVIVGTFHASDNFRYRGNGVFLFCKIPGQKSGRWPSGDIQASLVTVPADVRPVCTRDHPGVDMKSSPFDDSSHENSSFIAVACRVRAMHENGLSLIARRCLVGAANT